MVVLKNKSDFPLVLLMLAQCGLWFLTLWNFKSLSWSALVAAGVFQAFLILTNFQIVAHYFIHRRFFTSKRLNSIFSLLNSWNLGVPSSFYFAHHMNHHRFNNGPGDRSSTWLHGKKGQEEKLWRYSLLTPFRTSMVALLEDSLRFHSKSQVYAEIVLLFSTLAMVGFWSPAAAGYVILVIYVGQVLSAAENYLEHQGATPGHPKANAVSCYSTWYNKIWFNNGFHQEHHWKPTTHWQELPRLRSELPEESERRVVSQAHWIFWRT